MDGSISGVAGWRFTTYYNMLQKSGRCCGCWVMCDIMRGNGSDNARAEEQTHVSDSRQGYAARNRSQEGTSCRRLAVQGVRQAVRRAAGCGDSQGEDHHRCARLLLAQTWMQERHDAQDECRILVRQVGEERQP